MRYSPGRQPYSLALHPDAVADLEALYERDEEAAADIEVFLEQASLNQKTLDSVTWDRYVNYEDPRYDVKEIKKTRQPRYRYNLWRVRLLWLNGHASDYRIIYAFCPPERRYYVFGILPRDVAYDLNHERIAKILAAYDKLEIPRI